MTLRRKLSAIALGAGLALVAVIVGVRIIGAARGLVDVTEPLLREAEARWDAHRVDDYQVRIEVSGPLQGVYEMHVQSRKPRLVLFNSVPLDNERTKSTWTVEGMFRLIEMDLVNQATASKNGNRLVVRAAFDEALGYPVRYLRHDYLSRTTVSWHVTRFDLLPANSQDATQGVEPEPGSRAAPDSSFDHVTGS
jgi:hypothetical protein